MTEQSIPALERRQARSLDAWALLAMAAIGLAISAYLTTLHYAGASPVCANGGAFHCTAVTSSTYSLVPGTGIPVTVPGMIWFIVSGGLAARSLRCTRLGLPEPAWLRPGHAVWGGLGLLSVLYLVYAEVVLLHYICEWCTGVHILVFLSLVVAVVRLRPGAAPS